MHHRPLRRALALSLGALLALAGTAAADTVLADGDALTTTVEGTKHLGDVAPGAAVSADVRFVINCAGLNHIDANQSIVVSWSGGGTVPDDGAVVSVTTATLAPLTTTWAADAEGCDFPAPTQDGGALSRVTLRAPSTVGTHTFTIVWDRALQPGGNNDGSALTRLTALDLTLRVVAPPANTPPELTVPASFTVEGDTAGGWTAAWTDVSATDAEDDPDPVPSCVPAAGIPLPLGTTTVACSVRDLGGASADDTFDVTIVDTTAPTLAGMPANVTVTTTSSTGGAVTFTDPTATDVVDTAPTVGCEPISGSTFPVGTTTVTCSATDASGNSSAATFDVTIDLDTPAPGHTATATWLEPVAASGGTLVANRGRTIPVKVRLFVDGRERQLGDAGLTIEPCAGGSGRYVDLVWSGGRWNHALDTSQFTGPCYRVNATFDDLVAGAFTLELRGGEAAKATRGWAPRGHGYGKHQGHGHHPRRP